MKWKALFIIVEGLSLKQIENIFLEAESPTLRETNKENKKWEVLA